ncbi:MAG: hypothetical protein A3I66_00615 [Burkholderiales bacterium RIFCSPLOWO2_02_FULL_57_36]|nr:MAG: hypothetical protein A3I66_00615 [Burkholderiales bacterium RIFCSPLOWO2_02_FULL_57_36]
MKVVKPTPITSANLVSSTATEAHSEWSSVTTYALNDRVILAAAGRIYQCIVDPNTNHPPASSPLYWIDVGPTNKWAMFDEKISTQSAQATALTVVIKPGYVNSLAVFGLEGATLAVTVRDGLSGPVVYTYTKDLDGTIIADWYQYYFESSVQLADVVLTDLPPYGDAHITVEVGSGGTAKCGILIAGTVYVLGDTQYGATASITDYSRKDTDALGVTTFVRRAYSKRMSASLMLPNSQLNKVQRVLADLRATPCAWLGTDSAGFEPLTMFGFYRDFSIDVAYPAQSYCSLEVEGLT